MLNDKPCDTCDHFDVVLRGNSGKKVKGKLVSGTRETDWGWCAKKSVYPHTEGPGQRFPLEVKRVDKPEDLAKPVIVRKGQVAEHCTHFTSKKIKPSKAELLKTLQTQGGKVVLT
jgi:hypothetical protein